MSPADAAVNDCWNRIGVGGDASCAELTTHTHCRNCPVHHAAATRLLDRPITSAQQAEWTREIARGKAPEPNETRSLLLFRVEHEWLALPTRLFREVGGSRPIRPLPHRRNGVVLGLVNVRGQLLVCVSLRQLLALTPAAGTREAAASPGRLLVLEHDGLRLACPVDEVHGVQRVATDALLPAPASVARAATSYSRTVLSWQNRTVGLLDEQLLFHTLARSLTSPTAT